MSYENFPGRSGFIPLGPQRRLNGSATRSASPEPSLVSESQSETPTHLTVEQLVQQPGRELLTLLHPKRKGNSTWFGISANGISKSILKMLHSILEKPYYKYSDIPNKEKDMWFRTFAQEFNWDSAITKIVEKQFHKEARLQFSRNMSEWKQFWRKGKGKPKDLNSDVWVQYIPYWKDPATEATSQRNSRNRRSKRGNRGIYIHNGGSTSIQSRAEQMTQESGGVPPNHLDVIKDYHTNKKTGVVQDPVIREMIENVNHKVDMLNQQSMGELGREEINKLVLEELPIRKGRRPGLGKLSFGDGATFSNGFEYNEEVIRINAELQEKVNALESAKTETEEKFAMTQDELTTTKTTLENVMNFMKAKFPDCPSF